MRIYICTSGRNERIRKRNRIFIQRGDIFNNNFHIDYITGKSYTGKNCGKNRTGDSFTRRIRRKYEFITIKRRIHAIWRESAGT